MVHQKKINIGIVGAGSISDHHLKVYKSYDFINLSAIYSRTEKKAKEKSEKFGIKYYTNSINNFLKYTTYDGILILVSADQISKFVKKILPYKTPLFIEKPLSLNFKDLKHIQKINKKYKTPNMIGLNRRYYSIIHKILKLLNKDKIISIAVEGHENFWKIKKLDKKNIIKKKWIFANSIHTFDLLLFFANSKIKNINFINKKKNKLENNIISNIEFSNGILGSYTSLWSTPGQWSLKIYTQDNLILLNPLERGFIIDKNYNKKEIFPIEEDIKFKPGFYLQSKNFIKLIRTQKNSWPDLNIDTISDVYKIMNLMK